jgi:glutamine cyclotransferase
MKPFPFSLIILLSLFTTAFSCSNNSSKSRKPVSSISIQPNKNNYAFGEKIAVNVSTKVKNGEIESIKVYYKNDLVKESKELNFTIEDIEINTLGNSIITVEAVKTDGVSNTQSKTLYTLSNIVPEKFTYKIVNTYPHSKDYFTQGLEFHDGYIYEGTGENGASGIYKVNLTSGEAVQSVELNEKYFGEGITVLNNKIFQLTYRAKKGFVYDFNSFALIDSFQFSSITNEGWGLTNDGKNLIMSDGSQFLTWINPNDFSIVKRVEVGNNKAIYKHVNELEYINESIYANIYTTEMIVQIDSETGRILSEISFPDMIKMYHNQKDRIDLMNGIAWDEKNNRLFVTGKLWPKLFEIELVPLK